MIARHGIDKESRCGYAIGLSYPPDWGERTMSLRPGDRTVLEAGMTFHLIPAIWRDDWGLEITESFLVTPVAPSLSAPIRASCSSSLSAAAEADGIKGPIGIGVVSNAGPVVYQIHRGNMGRTASRGRTTV